MTLEQHEVTAFFDKIANSRKVLPDTNELSGWGTYQKYQHAVDLMAKPVVHRGLDLGCNIAPVEYLYSLQEPESLAKKLFVIGVDLSAASLRRAKAHGLKFADFTVANGLQLPFNCETFDLVVCIEVIEHVTDQVKFLQEIYRVLRPEGQLYLTTPNGNCVSLLLEEKLHRILRALFRRPQPAKDDFLNRERLIRLLNKVGFESFDTEDIYTLPRPFITFWGWSLTPPLPPKWGLLWQKTWNKLLGERGSSLPLPYRDIIYHTLSVQLTK